MEFQNLSQQPHESDNGFSLAAVLIVIVLAITLGFWASRLFHINLFNQSKNGNSLETVSTVDVKSKSDLEVGKVYGNTGKNFKDTAVGTIEKGSINGEGTHILNRAGGASQRASLTSSVVDLDLFVGRKVEVKGETNASNKTSWLLDVGSIKILE